MKRYLLPIKRLLLFSLLLCAILGVSNYAFGQTVGDYRSAATGNWNVLATWQRFNGTTWLTPTGGQGTPTSASGVITIRNGYIVTVNNNVTVDQVIVNAGGQVTINTNRYLQLNAGAGTDIDVYGTILNLDNSSGYNGFRYNRGATLAFGNGGIYQHGCDGGTIPTATWNSASTCNITGITATIPTVASFAQSFGNFTWNCSGQTGDLSLAQNLTDINGSLSIYSTGTGSLRLVNGNGSGTVSVAGNYDQTGGTLYICGTSNPSDLTLSVGGNFSLATGTLNINGQTGTSVLNVSGNFTMNSGTITETSSGTSNINFNGTTTQTFSKTGGTISNTINFSILNNAIVDFGISILDDDASNVATFNLNSGGTIITANTNAAGALTISGATGSIQVGGSRAYNIAANYTYGGTSAQNTGNGLTGANNLIINNSSGVILTSSTTVSGVLNLTSGILSTGANTVTVTSNSTSAITGGSNTSFVNGPLIWQLATGSTYSFPVGKGATYLPFGLTSITGTTPRIRVEAFTGNAGGTALSPLGSLSNTEYWLASVASGTYTTGSVSLTRQTALTGLDAIGRNTTTINGAYSNLNGTVSGISIITSDLTGNSLGYFVMAAKRTITTSAISGSFCAGASVSVPFTITGTFTSGNVFTAQLSSDGFASLVDIGTRTATDAGTINGTILAGTTYGTGYRIRVISSTPAVTGTDNENNLTVNPKPAITAMTANACSGIGFTVIPVDVTNGVVPAGTTYSWGVPAVTGGLTGGSAGSGAANISGTLTNPTITAQTAIYTVTPTSGSCIGSTFTVIVTVNSIPAAPTTSGSAICVGSTATLSASGAVAGDKYKWYDAATSGTLLKTSIDNADNTFVTPVLISTTNYWVSILNAIGCESSRTQVTATYPTTSPDDQNAAGTNSWIGHVYDGTNFTPYYGTYTETESFDQGFGGDYNCFTLNSSLGTRTIYTETFSVHYRMNSTKRGLYIADLGSDDGSRLTVDGTLLYNNWVDQSFSTRPRVLMNLNGASSLVYDYYENATNNRVVFQNLTLVLSNTLTTNTSQSIYIGSTGSAIIGDEFGTLPTGITLSGTGYQWTYSTTPITPPDARTNITGATGATYTPNASIAPFNTAGTYYIYRNTILSSANNVAPNPFIATNESNATTLTISDTPLITASAITLNGFNYSVGAGPSSEQSFTVSGSYLRSDLMVTPTTNYEISLTSGVSFVATNPILLTPSGGTVGTTIIYVRLKAGRLSGTYTGENITLSSTGATTQNVVCSGTVGSLPFITVSPTTLTGFSYTVGAGPSAQQWFSVSGAYLTSNIIVTPSANFEISTTSGSGFQATPITLTQTGGTVNSTTIYVRLKIGLTGGTYVENVTMTSTNASTQNVACSGIVNANVQIWKAGAYQASFATLKAAFDAINAGTYTGILDIKINGSIVDNLTATLYQSGYTGAGSTSNYSSVKIYPTVAGITLSGSMTAPLIDLNGADNVTIDGSVNALGSTKSLIISNTSTSNTAGTSTIRFINSAENNTVKYCTIKGSETNTSSGVVFFSTAATGNGNDGNSIDNNNITSNAAGRPINALYSLGSASFENSGNLILNNNIFDFWRTTGTSSAILLGYNTTDFTISLNSFYETTSLIPTGAIFNYRMVWVNNTTGNNFTISNNYFGGTTSLCGGAALSLGTAGTIRSVTLDPIEISAGTTTASSIQGNIINNISFRSSNAEPFRAINAVAGTLNIGTVTGNTIGSDTGNDSITVTSTIPTGNVYGIYIASSNNIDCQNNIIGSITAANSNGAATNLFGIYKTATVGTTTISKNIIGSITTANSLYTSSTSTTNSQTLIGIYSIGSGNTTISGNTIANISNNTNETTYASRLRGILTEAGSNDINTNEVHHLKSRGAANGANYPNTSLIGISQVSDTTGTTQNVSGNSVYNLTNDATVKMEMYGIYYNGPPTGTNTISRNFVHSYFIKSTDQAYLHGISLYGGAFTASNNIVYLGSTITTGCSMWAMWTNSTNSIRIYHNTLYLGGKAATGSSNTYAFRSLNAGPTDAIIKNNILWNGRTNSSNVISHYAIYLQSSANTSVDYNDFRFYQEFGRVGSSTYANFVAWKAGTGFDANSTETDPLLVNLGGTLPTDYQTSVPLDGVPGTGILTDYNGVVRSTTAPTMGAWEFFRNPVEVWNGTIFRADYPTLKGAFDKINDGTWTGDLIIKFRGNTTETASAVLNASGTGLSSYTTILIYPVRLGVTVTGSLAVPMVDLNGCDNVTFDGRKDATGTASEITFSNTSTSNVAGTATFRFINDATNNTIKYCNIKGSSTNATAGIIFFSTTSGTTGNDGNTIDNNTITNSTDANRPLNAIYSAGTSAKENSGNTISNNNIYNFLNKGTASNGIQLADYNTMWTITENSFYETASFAPTAAVAYNVIYINNTSGTGSGFTVNGNYIGGNATSCGGTAWTKAATFDSPFTAISLNVGIGTVSSIQNNTIKNMAWSNSGAATWTGINITAGLVNIGTIIGNTIGATTGTNSITVTNGTTAASVYGINIVSTGTVDCQNNIIGSFTAANSAANATNFFGINKTATAGTTTISNNTIGSVTTANSINASSASTGNAQSVYGIYNAGTGTISISSNTIANLRNTTSNTIAATLGLINGIASTNGTNIITSNIIRNLTIANANTAATNSASVIGIVLTGNTAVRTISGNTIYNLSNTYATFIGRVAGIYYEGSTSETETNVVSRNFIHSLSTTGTSGASLFGIWIVSGITTYSNNIVNLGSSNQNLIYGLYDTGAASQICNFYFNTIYIGGVVATGAYNSYAFYNAAANGTRNYLNNIFSNARSRSGGTSSHFAIYFAATGGTLTINYNDYYAVGTGGVLGYYNGANRTTIVAWRTATGQDVNSVVTNPVFVLAGSTIATDYKIGVSLSGITGTGIVIDYGSNSRGSTPTMGAWERNVNKWKGTISIDWNIDGNWTGNTVPLADATIVFDDVPVRHCQLDHDRSVTDIINAQSTYRMVTNGHKLTVKGNFNFTNGAQIDASATNSDIELAGASAQIIPAGTFYNNEVYDLTVNNANDVTLYGTMRLLHEITANAGRLDATTTTPTVVYAGTAPQTIESNRYINDFIYNLTIDNVSGVALATTAEIYVPHDLTITRGILTVPPGATLTVDNYTKLDYRAPLPVPYPLQIDYWSCLILKSNATSTGSFIHSDLFTGIGTVKVERYMSNTNNWHLYSSPMKDQSVHDFLKYNPEIPDLFNTLVTPNVLIGVGIRDYNTPTDVWNPYYVYTSSSTTPPGIIGGGKGFNIRTYNDIIGTGTVDATGIPNLNTVNVTLTRTVASTDKGWNCIGNPFTSALNIRNIANDGFLDAANSGQLDPDFVAVYVWDTNNITTTHTTPEYIVINNATSITSVQIGQGFFVKSKTGGGSVRFTKTMQFPNSALTFKSAVTEWPSIKIVAKDLTSSSSTEIKIIPNTTEGLDPGYDAGMYKVNPEFALYSKLLDDNGVDFTLQCLPDQNFDKYVIPIGIDYKAGGQITFTAETVNLSSGCQAVLEDRTTKRFTRLDLKDANYTAYVNPDTKGTGRFFLHTSDVISSDQPLENQLFKVYTIGKIVYINGEVSDNAKFFLYSVNGKQLINFKAENQIQNRLDASEFPAGVYILTIDDKNQKKSIKFVIEN